MTTHEYPADARYALEDVVPPNAETEQRQEPTVPAASSVDRAGQHAETSPAQSSESAAPGSGADHTETGGVTGAAESPTSRALFADDELAGLRARWDTVQAGFVDDPKDCVHKADGLVSDVVDQLTTGFTQARSRLEEHWSRGEEASTEDLRLALKGYREFFERLLAV